MPGLPVQLRNDFLKSIVRARQVAEEGAETALRALAVHHHEPYPYMSTEQRKLRNWLRAHGRQLGDRLDQRTGSQEITRIVHECAYQHWHRMLFARFLAENSLLVEPSTGVAITMAECEELAREAGTDTYVLASQYAQRMLPQVFPVDNPVLGISLSPEVRQSLEKELSSVPVAVFLADDALGWTYQFWQTEAKDRVNARVDSGERITGDMLPAVTQLFTEDYMVSFLLHNTLGAWHAGKALRKNPALAKARDEDQMRRAVSLPGYSWDYLRFVCQADGSEADTGRDSSWQPAAGVFEHWPVDAAGLRVLDPCCGSGHFLVAAFELITTIRRQEEGLSTEQAVFATLGENIFGLELDHRCTQIAAFNLALAAWKRAGRVIDLPPLNIACSGLSLGVGRNEWLKLAGRDQRLQKGMEQLYDVFRLAPELGSLIDPGESVRGDFLTATFEELKPLLESALSRETREQSETQWEVGIAAQGMARAAEMMSSRYHLVITNVPYLKRGKQGEVLREFSELHYGSSKNDLATVFLKRCLRYCHGGGTASLVMPQNWLFLTSYKKMREELLAGETWDFVAWLGPGAFETVSGEVVKAVLISISRATLTAGVDHVFSGIDASEPKEPQAKAELLRRGALSRVAQRQQLQSPDARVVVEAQGKHGHLSEYGYCHHGLTSGDMPRMKLGFWELTSEQKQWYPYQSTVKYTVAYGGHESLLRWHGGEGAFEELVGARLDGTAAWGKAGVLVSQMGELPVSLYAKHAFDNNTSVIIPNDPLHLPAIWCFCSSPEYNEAVRRIDQKLNVTNATLVKVPFELEYWQKVATERYPHGLPEPYSDDPTQWIFHGHPVPSENPLQVAVARLLGYRWTAELDSGMELSTEAHHWVRQSEDLLPLADDDGIVCLPALRSKQTATEGLRDMLRAAYGDGWSPTKERELLQGASGNGTSARSLEEWLRDYFFAEHCKLFHHRPFIWQIWDGHPSGFSALVNYHRLAGEKGQGRRTLESLAYSYLGTWIERQRAEVAEGREGADGRLQAALDLQQQLVAILEGEPPYDIFVRWKPLHEQPLGWAPDANDGVRLNIRPFMSAQLRKGGRSGAGILRWKPNIKWSKDRGKEVEEMRPREEFPWFWSCSPEEHPGHTTDFMGGREFDGVRWNDLHYSRRAKELARATASKGGV